MGETIHGAAARLGLAWHGDGLFVAVDVQGSRVFVPDPRQFWVGDTLELLLDTQGDGQARTGGYAATDHHLWACPQLDSGEVYVGRWKRGQEIAATQYGLEGARGSSRRTETGYVMEFLVPASALTGINLAPNARIGLAFSLSVAGPTHAAEFYWPRSKEVGLINEPGNWAGGVLAP